MSIIFFFGGMFVSISIATIFQKHFEKLMFYTQFVIWLFSGLYVLSSPNINIEVIIFGIIFILIGSKIFYDFDIKKKNKNI